MDRISLSKEGKRMSFDKFKETFAHAFNEAEKREGLVESEYERLTGRKVGDTGTSKKAKKRKSKSDSAEGGSGEQPYSGGLGDGSADDRDQGGREED